MNIDISKFAKLLHEYVDTYVKYKDADNTEKIRLWLLLSDEAKELFLYFSKLQKDNDALKKRIETLQIYADDYWERLKAHRKITRSLNARIAELEAEVTKGHELQDAYCDRIAELERDVKWREESISTIEHALANNEDDIEMLESRITELDAERRWIPVSERLPEKQKLTIGFTDNSAYVFFEIVNDDEMGLAMYPYQNRKGNVTHWMPLPESPNDTQSSTIVYGKDVSRSVK